MTFIVSYDSICHTHGWPQQSGTVCLVQPGPKPRALFLKPTPWAAGESGIIIIQSSTSLKKWLVYLKVKGLCV